MHWPSALYKLLLPNAPCSAAYGLVLLLTQHLVSALSEQTPDSEPAGTAPGTSPDSRNLENHPFYRVPQRPQGLQISPVTVSYDRLIWAHLDLSVKLEPLRQACANNFVDAHVFELIVANVYDLLGYAKELFERDLPQRPIRLREALARHLLVLDALWVTGEIGGPEMQRASWWDPLMANMKKPLIHAQHPERNHPFVKNLLAALEYYRSGMRPPAPLLVGLKQAIFCFPRIALYRKPQWKRWRDDDQRWRDGQQGQRR